MLLTLTLLSYYGLEDVDQDSVDTFLSGLVDTALWKLEEDGCVTIDEDGSVLCKLNLIITVFRQR